MKTKKQNADFVYVGHLLLAWYQKHGRNLPFRKTKNPYYIWIAEIVFQQTRIEQGLGHYQNFIRSFPSVQDLAAASVDDVLLCWKGLGYYSRAINLHAAANQIITTFNGEFPSSYQELLTLKGVGKYTAAAVSSICFSEQRAAVDGNLYRVLSRFFADDYDISFPDAFSYFSELAQRLMPENEAGNFNQALMDLGASICKPRNPECEKCPLSKNCFAFDFQKTADFPVKSKKVKIANDYLTYYFIYHKKEFLIIRRDETSIWKRLYEFPQTLPRDFENFIELKTEIKHKLTHRNLEIAIWKVNVPSVDLFEDFAVRNAFQTVNSENAGNFSFPKPLENFIATHFYAQSQEEPKQAAL